MKKFKILIACECSGMIRDAFRKLGYDAVSCDLLPSEKPGKHFLGDVRKILKKGWDLMIAHPPCTHLAVSGAKFFKKKIKVQMLALDFVWLLMNAPIKHVCIENPVSVISSVIRKPDQIIQPWEYGDSFQKKTCLWLKNLPKLKPTKIVSKGKFVTMPNGKKMAKWYYDALSLPKEQRTRIRSMTFPGIAKAMAKQWGKFLEQNCK